MSVAQIAERARLQMEATLLTDRADIMAPVMDADGYGGTVEDVRVVAEAVPCRVRAITTAVTEEGAATTARQSWEVRLPIFAPARPGHRIKVDSATYLVESTDSGRTGALTLLATCSRLEI